MTRRLPHLTCNGCGAVFASINAFDLHRSGKHGRHETGWTGWLRRWCVPPGQVRDKSGDYPLRQRPDGVWEHTADAERARKAFGHASQASGTSV